MVDAFTKRELECNPIQAKILKKVFTAMRNAHDPITSVNNGEETIPVETLDEVNTAVFAVSDCFLEMASGRWVRFVSVNDWDCISDYSVSLEDSLSKVNAYVQKYMD